jgi:hypothetical protein
MGPPTPRHTDNVSTVNSATPHREKTTPGQRDRARQTRESTITPSQRDRGRNHDEEQSDDELPDPITALQKAKQASQKRGSRRGHEDDESDHEDPVQEEENAPEGSYIRPFERTTKSIRLNVSLRTLM